MVRNGLITYVLICTGLLVSLKAANAAGCKRLDSSPGNLVDAENCIYLPAVRDDAAPTPEPTPTPDPCSQLVSNGSFEQGLSGWKPRGQPNVVEKYLTITPFEGQHFLVFKPRNDDTESLSSEAFDLPASREYQVTLRFAIWTRTTDSRQNADQLGIGVVRYDRPGMFNYLSIIGNANDDGWRVWERDVTKSVFAGKMTMFLDASNDPDQPTEWYIDAISLKACPSGRQNSSVSDSSAHTSLPEQMPNGSAQHRLTGRLLHAW